MGGAEVFTHELAKGLTKKGHQITLFTSAFPNSKNHETIDGIEVFRAGGKYGVYRAAKKHYLERFAKERFDVVVDEINTVPFLTPKFVNNGEKVFALIHQLAREYWFYETHFPVNLLGRYYFENRWLKNYRAIPTFTVSQSTRDDLTRLGFNTVHVLPEGLNFEPLDSLPEKTPHPTIVYCGRLKRAKRPDHLIKAFVKIGKNYPDAELWIIGDGQFKTELEAMAGQGVTFFGGLNSVQRRGLLQKAWVLVNPSAREGFGLNIIESNALGTPCVAYDVAGLRDSVKVGKTGLLAENGNIEDLTTKINYLISDDGFRAALSEDALAYSRLFSWENCTTSFLNFIQQ
jgi:glycosyltransferase involved in cell wall biosynthesis